MSLDCFSVDPKSTDWILGTFQESSSLLRLCCVVTQGGHEVLARPIGMPRGDADPLLIFRGLDGRQYQFRLSELASVEPDAIRSDSDYMDVAIRESRRCVAEAPKDPKAGPKVTPFVGAMLVVDVVPLAQAYRGELAPGDHTEFTLLETKLGGRILAGSVLYTTLEPCTKRGIGKTECVERVIQRQIKRVVIGTLDPNKEIRGEGFYRLRESGIEVGCAMHGRWRKSKTSIARSSRTIARAPHPPSDQVWKQSHAFAREAIVRSAKGARCPRETGYGLVYVLIGTVVHQGADGIDNLLWLYTLMIAVAGDSWAAVP